MALQHTMFFSLAVLCSITLVSAYPGGATNASCSDLTPVHDAISRNASLSPYKVYVQGQDIVDRILHVNNSAQVKIQLKKIDDTAPGFKGFLCAAEITGQRRRGYFTGDSTVARQACDFSDGVTHNSAVVKDFMEVTWHAPAAPFSFKVEIWCTFVQTKTVFWRWVKGDFDINVNVPMPVTLPPPPMSEVPPTEPAPTQAVGEETPASPTDPTTGASEPTTAGKDTTADSTVGETTVSESTKAPEVTKKSDSHDPHLHPPPTGSKTKTGASKESNAVTVLTSWTLLVASMLLVRL